MGTTTIYPLLMLMLSRLLAHEVLRLRDTYPAYNNLRMNGTYVVARRIRALVFCWVMIIRCLSLLVVLCGIKAHALCV
jgi:hypothetical protein